MKFAITLFFNLTALFTVFELGHSVRTSPRRRPDLAFEHPGYEILPRCQILTVPDIDLVTKNADGHFIPLKPPYKSFSSPGPDEAIVAVWIQGYIRGIYRAEYPNPRVKLYKDARGAHLMELFERNFYPVDELIELPASTTAPRSGSGHTSRRIGRPSRGRGRSLSGTGPSSSRQGPLSSGHGPSLNKNGSSTSETGPSSSRSGPSSSGHGPSLNGNGSSTSETGPSSSRKGPSSSGHGPSLNRNGSSTSEYGPSSSRSGPSSSEYGPSSSGNGPSTSGSGPSSSGKGPSPSESDTSSSGYGPSTSENGPSSRRQQFS